MLVWTSIRGMLCMVGRSSPVPLRSKVTIHPPSVPSCGRTVRWYDGVVRGQDTDGEYCMLE